MPLSVTRAPTGASRGARSPIETGGWLCVVNAVVEADASGLPSTSRSAVVSCTSYDVAKASGLSGSNTKLP